ncbi:MAG TPA: succinate dehydrogenase, cytochrome b556 subunit [Burkholderiales bacterium]|jgi:succinate dehydrogenase / fumarate reductase cytochrome b subunit|nr:succinate dehydrogenase, cytochrome b556 subunit [Burkholderiales bacterium]
MQQRTKRPVYLNLFLIRLPIGGVVSILHRITGALLVVLTVFFLWALQASLASPARFGEIQSLLSAGLGRMVVLLALWILIQHLYSGVRHLLIDVDIGVERTSARRSAGLTLVASVATVLLLSTVV